METLIYIAKASLLLSVFLCVYKLMLNRESFIQVNRLYLILGLILSFSLPLMTFTKIELKEVEAPIETLVVEPSIQFIEQQIPIANTNPLEVVVNEASIWKQISLENALLFMYGLGILFFFGKLVYQSSSLVKLLHKSKKIKKDRIFYFEANQRIEAFSFFNIMAYNPNLHAEDELKIIKTHEEIHIKEWHSIDMVLGNLACMFLWFLPFVYSYRASIDENLEYIADAKTAEKTKSVKKYQYTLLNYFALETNMQYASYFFKQSSLKNRIIMLNKEKSDTRKLFRYGLILPFVIGFIWFFQTETLAKEFYIEIENTPIKKTGFSALKSTEAKLDIETVEVFQKDTTSQSNVDMIELKIDKTTTDKELKEAEEFFDSLEQKLKFTKIKRNKDGEIIRIKIKFSEKEDGLQKENYISGNDPIKEYVIKRDFKNESIAISEYQKPKEGIYTLLNKAKVIIINGEEYEKDYPLAITDVLIEKNDGKLLEISAKKLEETEASKIYKLYLDKEDDKIREVYLYKNFEGLEGNDASLMRLEINNSDKKFLKGFEHAYGKEPTKKTKIDFYGDVEDENIDKLKKQIENNSKIKLNGQAFDPNKNSGKVILIEGFSFDDEYITIKGEAKKINFSNVSETLHFANKLNTFLMIGDNGKTNLATLNNTKQNYTLNKPTMTSSREKIEEQYQTLDFVYINNEKVSKKDLIDKILVYKNLRFDDDQLYFSDAELFYNNGNTEIGGIISQTIKKNFQMSNEQILWFETDEKIQLAIVHNSNFSVSKPTLLKLPLFEPKSLVNQSIFNINDTFLYDEKEVAVQNYLKEVRFNDANGENPIFIIDGEIVSKEILKKVNPQQIKSINVIKEYDKLPEELKANKEISEEDFDGLIQIELKKEGSDKDKTSEIKLYTIEGGNPIFIIDGEVENNEMFKKIKPQQIESVSVIKAYNKLPEELKANKEISEEDFDGVIQIELKKPNKVFYSPDSSFFDKTHVNTFYVLDGKVIGIEELRDKVVGKEINTVALFHNFNSLPKKIKKLKGVSEEEFNQLFLIKLKEK